jgi:hypothetical protein
MNFNFHILLVYFYLILGLLIIFLEIEVSKNIWGTYVTLIIFFTLKWLFNYRKCTISYIEYKLRDSKKDNCLLYKFMENMIDLRYNKEITKIYLISIFILFDYFIIKKNSLEFP